MVSKFQWKPFWLATQRDPQNDWTPNRVNYDVFGQAPFFAIPGWTPQEQHPFFAASVDKPPRVSTNVMST